MKFATDALFGPEILLNILDPLEIGDDNPSGVGKDIRDYENAPFIEDLIGPGIVGPLAPSAMILA